MKALLLGFLTLTMSFSTYASSSEVLDSFLFCNGKVEIDGLKEKLPLSLQLYTIGRSELKYGNIVLTPTVAAKDVKLGRMASNMITNINIEGNRDDAEVKLYSDYAQVDLSIVRSPNEFNKAYLTGKVGPANFSNLVCDIEGL